LFYVSLGTVQNYNFSTEIKNILRFLAGNIF
jgi:hypothetical protein